MPTKRSEKIKQYIVIALAVVAVVVAYFRFFHKGTPPRADVAARPQPQGKVNLQKAEKPRPQMPPAAPFPVEDFLNPDVRDIFEPGVLPPDPGVEKKAEGEKGAGPKAAPTVGLDLQGTIIGGKSPLAIINNKFFRVGEKIGSYRIVAIAPNTVYLKAGRHQKVIRVLEPAQK